MRAILADRSLRKLGTHVRQMATGKLVGAGLHLLAMAWTARTLGPAPFGVLVLARGYAAGVSGLAKFQSWQAIVHFGARALDRQDRQRFADLLSFATLLDLATGIAAAVAAALLLPLAGPLFGLGSAGLVPALLYCAAIPTMAAASPTGVLRLYGRFDLIGLQSVVTPAARLLGLVAASAAQAPLGGYVAAWLVSDLIGDLFLWACAIRLARRERLFAGVRPRPGEALRSEAGLWRFLLSTNASASLELAWGAGSTLVIGGMLGAAAAGSFRIALQVFDALVKPAELAARSFFPEVSRIAAAGDWKRLLTLGDRMLIVSAIIAAALAMAMALAGPAVAVAAVGASFAGTGTLLQALAPALFLTVAAYPFEPLLLTRGMAGRLFWARLVGTASFALLLVPALNGLGLPGAAVAYAAAAALIPVLQARLLRKVRKML